MFLKTVCFLLAVVLTAASVLIMFPELAETYLPKVSLENALIDFKSIDIRSFPFHGGSGEEGGYGVYELVKGIQAITQETAPGIPDKLVEGLGQIYARADFWQVLYAFCLIALMSIPVYMVLRLLVFNSVYKIASRWFFPLRIFWYGITGVSASLVTVTAAWLVYKTVLYDIVLDFLKTALESLTKNVTFALATTNILTVVVIALLVFVLLRATLFRGSIFTSLLGALLRSVLYVVLIAGFEVFVIEKTGVAILVLCVFVLLVGLVKAIFLSDKHASLRG